MTPEELYERLGAHLAVARRRRGLTQQQVAQACGLSRPSVANIEAGRQWIQVHTLHDLCDALGTTAAEMLRRAARTGQGEHPHGNPAR